MAIAKRPDPKEMFKQVAMDIGKQVIHHIETMYPQAIAATSSTFKLSVRNCVYNEIMAASQIQNWVDMLIRLEVRKAHRQSMAAAYRSIRAKKVIE